MGLDRPEAVNKIYLLTYLLYQKLSVLPEIFPALNGYANSILLH